MPRGVTIWPSAASCAMGTSRYTHRRIDEPDHVGKNSIRDSNYAHADADRPSFCQQFCQHETAIPSERRAAIYSLSKVERSRRVQYPPEGVEHEKRHFPFRPFCVIMAG